MSSRSKSRIWPCWIIGMTEVVGAKGKGRDSEDETSHIDPPLIRKGRRHSGHCMRRLAGLTDGE